MYTTNIDYQNYSVKILPKTITLGCKTVAGPVPDATCIFPFEYKGIEYKTCIAEGSTETTWCATDRKPDFRERGLYGYCNITTCPHLGELFNDY